MLKELKISHLILIEQAHIHFEKGFTVLSGETGAGKSAILEALKLVLGGKTDTSLIRNEADKALVVAVFDLENLPKARNLLNEKGIDSEDPNLLILQREITRVGKTRSTVNHQPVQLSVLRELSATLLELVSQHANHKLFETDEHMKMLDLFGNYSSIIKRYEHSWKYHQELTRELHNLRNSVPNSVREFENCKREIQEIESANLKEDEEEYLFEKYSLLASLKSRKASALELLNSIESASSIIARSRHAYTSLQSNDPKFSDELILFPQIQVELEELKHTLSRYENRLDEDPSKLELYHKRLDLIERLKQKYGDTFKKIQDHLSNQKERLIYFKNIETLLEEKAAAYHESLCEIKQLAEQLTEERKKCAEQFSFNMSILLHSLNMENAQFYVEISPHILSLNGQDKVEFFLSTNVGEKKIALKESASGGEIARVLLALHVLLAGKEKIGTLIFDEIDANIGGTTASLMAKRLMELGNTMQVISITHFPQVAKCAKHHLQITKSSIGGRTLSQISYLSSEKKKKELIRMQGGFDI